VDTESAAQKRRRMPAAVAHEAHYNGLSMRNLKFARFAWLTLAYTVAVVLWGAIVRATGSGAGCGESWPLCNGRLVFGTPALAKLIELAHRSSSGIDGILIAGMAIWAFRAFPKPHPARLGATISLFLLVVEALLGAALVKFGLVVNDPSPTRAVVLSIHLANTLALIAAITLTAWWGGGRPRGPLDSRAWASLAGVVGVGITGALSALADTLYPSTSLEAGLLQDLNAGANWLVRLRALHPLLALLVGVWVAYYASSRVLNARRPAIWVMALVALQIAVGVVNLAMLAPLGMQVTHLLLADLLWISLVVLCQA
jgi:heme a synthase